MTGTSACPTFATFCDGFENGLGAWTGQSSSTGASDEIDCTRWFDGKCSFHATGPSSGRALTYLDFAPVATPPRSNPR